MKPGMHIGVPSVGAKAHADAILLRAHNDSGYPAQLDHIRCIDAQRKHQLHALMPGDMQRISLQEDTVGTDVSRNTARHAFGVSGGQVNDYLDWFSVAGAAFHNN